MDIVHVRHLILKDTRWTPSDINMVMEFLGMDLDYFNLFFKIPFDYDGKSMLGWDIEKEIRLDLLNKVWTSIPRQEKPYDDYKVSSSMSIEFGDLDDTPSSVNITLSNESFDAFVSGLENPSKFDTTELKKAISEDKSVDKVIQKARDIAKDRIYRPNTKKEKNATDRVIAEARELVIKRGNIYVPKSLRPFLNKAYVIDPESGCITGTVFKDNDT